MGVVWHLILTRVAGNGFDDSTGCRFAASFIFSRCLQNVYIDVEPSSCIRRVQWQQASLAVPPDEVVSQGWMPVIKFLQGGPCESVHELRLMLIGDGEVGKTSLSRAFAALDRRAGRIGKEQRTVGIDLTMLSFAAEDGTDITCQVCDFAGQEIYHLSHTLHFTRRCLYLLMWTSHKFSESEATIVMGVDDILGPLKCWLQLLAANVPEANVLVVGTHCKVDPDAFAVMQQRVDKDLKEEMERLRYIADEEAKATREVLNLQTIKVRDLVSQIKLNLSVMQNRLNVPEHYESLLRHEEFVQALGVLKPKPIRSLLLKARALLQAMQELSRTRLRLGRLHGVYDGSIPAASVGVAHLKLVNERSFAVDSVEGVGVAELLRVIEVTCRDSSALPFMGEQIPVSWLQVKEALKLQAVRDVVGDCVMSVGDVAVKVCAALQQREFEIDVERARALPVKDVRRSLEFWSLLGRVFVHDGYFLRDAWFVIELLKPLVHHSVTSRKFMQDFCTGSFEGMSDSLQQLQHAAVLDHRLLPRFKAWAAASPQARQSIMQFFKESFMISDFSFAYAVHVDRSLVTARLCDSSNTDRQREVAAQAAAIEAASEYYAVYTLPSAHIGLIARMQATVALLQRCHLEVSCGKDYICLTRSGRMKCCVSVRRLEEVFKSKLGSLKEWMPLDQYSHAFSICSNDDGMFAFAARCVDEMMQSCAFGSIYQSWLPCRPVQCAQDGAAWRPKYADWVRLETAGAPMRLFEMLSSNASDVVIQSRDLRLKDVLPRKSPIFMSHTYSGDGTGEFCQRMKDSLQEKMICTVWFDKTEMNWTSAFVEEMQNGMRSACFFVICLTPLYLTRPHCLRELRWALDMCTAAGSNKKMLVMPLHPAVSFKGCQRILEAEKAGRLAHVFLRCDDRIKDRPSQMDELKGHRLSKEAILLLNRLTDQYAASIRPDWLKLQPWLSDELGADWEETSSVWADQATVSAGDLLATSFPVITACMAAPLPITDSGFVNFTLEELVASPPSQEYLTPSNVAVIRQCYPLSYAVLLEQDLAALVHLGLSDEDIMGCVEHGYNKSSVLVGQANPVDPTFRLAAHMSGVNFTQYRARRNLQQQHTNPNDDRRFSVVIDILQQLNEAGNISVFKQAPQNATSAHNLILQIMSRHDIFIFEYHLFTFSCIY
jgi:GTPase SAR1 family protein